jgi:c-di-GMP-binding flagellar brake protein YcgR
MTSPLPEPDSPALERFAVYARAEVIGLLRQMLKEGILVNVYYERGAALLTALLSVDPEHEQIIVDAAPDAEQQRRLLASRDLRFVAFVHGVKVQFGAERVDAALYDGRQALRLRLPQRLIRMQRRDYFRVRPLATRPATCTVRDEHGAVVAVWRVIDVGGGGLAFACEREISPYALGAEVRDCTIDLPGEGAIVTGLRVRSAEPLRRGGGLRIGCEFVFMAPQARQAVQRYINRVEAEQRKSAAS